MIYIKLYFRLVLLIILTSPLSCIAVEDEVSISQEIEESYLNGKFDSISEPELAHLGFFMSFSDMDDELGVLTVSSLDKLLRLIEGNEVDIYFSLFTENQQLLLLMPRYEGNKSKFSVATGHVFRVTISSRSGIENIKPGVVYSFDMQLRR